MKKKIYCYTVLHTGLESLEKSLKLTFKYIYSKDTGCSDKNGGYIFVIGSDIKLTKEEINELYEYYPASHDWDTSILDPLFPKFHNIELKGF